jgi:hypothetical protein
MRPTAERRYWAGLAAACQAGPLRNGVRPDTAQPSWLFQPTRGKQGRKNPPRRRWLAGEIQPGDRRWSAGKQLESGPGRWWLRFEAKGGGRLIEGSSPRRRARAGKSRQRQTGEGFEAGVEVDIEVPGTRVVLGVE